MKISSSPRSLLFWFCAIMLFFAIGFSAKAQVSLTNFDTYTQDFNTLTSSTNTSYFFHNQTVPGWYLQHENYNYPGYPIAGNDGSNTSLNFFSYGNNGSSDRALGGMANGINSGSGYVGFRVKNNTGAVIRNFEITYTLEQWYNSGKLAKFDFSYATKPVGTPITSLINSSANWIHVDEMDVTTPSTTSPIGKKNGNDPSHRINKKFTLIEINLQPNQEIMLRWQYVTTNATNGNGLALDDVAVTPQINVFYAKTYGSLTNLNMWTRNEDGTGGSPTDFSLANQIFHITKGSGRKLDNKITLGTNSKIVLGNGLDPITLEIKKESNPFIGTIDVLNGATLVLNNPDSPDLQKLSDESTIVYQASDASQVQILSKEVYGNLVFSGASKKQLAQHVLVNGNLTLNDSHLYLGNFNLTVHKSKHVIGGGENGYVHTDGMGKLWLTVPRTEIDVLFPVGNNTYNPIVLKQTSAGEEDVFKVRVLDGVYKRYINKGLQALEPIAENAVNRTWLVEEHTTGGSDLTMTTYYTLDNALPGFLNEAAFVSHYENDEWDAVENCNVSVVENMNTLTRSNISTFSPFGVLSDQTLLPVELVYFRASYLNAQVDLTWETMSETDNDYFTIESSVDGKDFVEIANLPGAGKSNDRISYSFTDTRNLSGQIYYRLRQTDFNGNSTLSSIVSVIIPARSFVAVPHPNPTSNRVNIPVSSTGSSVVISVYDIAGNAVFSEVKNPFEEYITIDMSQLLPRVYLVEVQYADQREYFRVLKL